MEFTCCKGLEAQDFVNYSEVLSSQILGSRLVEKTAKISTVCDSSFI